MPVNNDRPPNHRHQLVHKRHDQKLPGNCKYHYCNDQPSRCRIPGCNYAINVNIARLPDIQIYPEDIVNGAR